MALFSFDRSNLKYIDWWIVGSLLALTAFGVLVIYGTTYETHQSLPKLQMRWWAISLAVFIFILCIDYSQLTKLSWVAYIVCLAMLAGLLAIRWVAVRRGADWYVASWYDLGPGRFQPSEFTKIVVVMAVAAYLAAIKARLPGWLDHVAVALIVAAPFLLIAMQPDMGTSAVFLPLIVVMPWAAGASRRIYLILAGIAVGLVVAYATAVVIRKGDYPFLKPYQERRVNAFLSGLLPDKWSQIEELGLDSSISESADWAPRQAVIAIGSGRVWGKGWLKGTQTRLEFLPVAHADYIYSSCGEQFGFVGCALVLGLYLILVYRSLLMALRAKDWFGYLIVVGVLTIFVTHVFLNIGVATNILPVTGLPLPFMSAGGSFLLTMYIGFALVVNVGMRKYWF